MNQDIDVPEESAADPKELRKLRERCERAEAALKESKTALEDSDMFLGAVFEGAPFPMAVIRHSSGIDRCNAAFCRMLGYTEQELVGKGPRHLNSPDYEPLELAGNTIKKCYLTKTGDNVWVVVKVSEDLHLSDGSIARLLMVDDITDRREAEGRLRTSEELFRAAFEEAPFGMAFLRDRHFLRVNARFCAMLGYAEDELHGRDPYEFTHPDDRDVRDTSSQGTEKRYVRKDGSFLWANTKSVSLSEPGNTLAMVEDITARKEAWDRVLRSESLFRTLFEQSAVGLAIADENSIVKGANPTLCRMWGYTEEELVGRSGLELIHPDDRSIPIISNPHVEPGIVAEIRFIRKDGSAVWNAVITTPIHDQAGTYLYNLAMFQDISTQKDAAAAQARAESEREDAERRLEEQRVRSLRSDRFRALGEMATGMAHEMNQPLMGVRGAAEHLLLGLERGWQMDEATFGERLGRIIRQADRMSELLHHLRDFARRATNDDMENVDLNDVVLACKEFTQTHLKTLNIYFVCDLAPGLPQVRGNQASLVEAVLNLMSNARDALLEAASSSRDLTMTVRTESDPLDGSVLLTVSDNGIGIPPEILFQVCDPFFTTKPPNEASGLGLSISRSVVENCGGRLDIESESGNGARVTLSLPQVLEAVEPTTRKGVG